MISEYGTNKGYYQEQRILHSPLCPFFLHLQMQQLL